MQHIDLKKVEEYLENNSWTIEEFNNKLQKIKKSFPDHQSEIIIPKTEEIKDYNARIKELIAALAILEEKSEKEIREFISNVGFDILRYRLISENTTEGTFPLKAFPSAVKNIKNSIKYSACSEIREESQFRRPFKAAEELIEQCEIGQTEKGSFVVIVKVPSQKINEEDNDLGRKTVERLVSGLKEVKSINIENENSFQQSYSKKLNRNVCEAISQLIDSGENKFKFEISTKWDSTNSQEETIPSTAEIAPDIEFQKLNKMSNYLKKIPSSEDTTIRGLINIMKHTEIDSPEEKRLIIIHDKSKNKKVYVRLSDEEYLKACNAHRDTKEVIVSGFLNKKTVHWVLDSPINFEVIENNTES